MRPLTGGLLGGKILRNISRSARRLDSASNALVEGRAKATFSVPIIDAATEVAAACARNSLLVIPVSFGAMRVFSLQVRPLNANKSRTSGHPCFPCFLL